MGKYKVDISGIDTKDLTSLSCDEMKKLFVLYKNDNDLCARDMLINGNMKLVLSILKRFYNKSDNLDDLFQIGCVGLIKAIDNFDLAYDVRFSTYAVPMILGEIKRYIRDSNSIKISRSIKDIAYKTLKLKEDIYLKTGFEPSIKEIADILNVEEYDVSNALDSLREPVSMYEPIYNDGGDTIYLCDQISNKKEDYDLDHKLAIEKAISKLKLRDRQILESRFIIGKTQMEIASELGISQAQISRIEKNAINNIKKYVK